jgi:transaldolase
MMENPLLQLKQYGQSIWLDLLSRELLRSGKLRRLRDEDGVSGVTSNPAIFEKAINGSSDYDAEIRRLAEEGRSPSEIYEALTVADIRDAADLLRPVYDSSKGLDGFVSLEVSPLLARDTGGTIREAKHLWSIVNRPNAMIKIPATVEGLPAIAECIREGININVTLLFGLSRYRQVIDAWLHGLEERAADGGELAGIRSVASFFLSRIDVLVDPMLETSGDGRSLKGQTAIASAKLAYQIYTEVFSTSRWNALERRGARKQWLLWGSTSTKTEGYSDVKYVEALIGPDTVNTLPIETLEAFRDHGRPALSLVEGIVDAREVMARLAELGIDMDHISRVLEAQGVEKFVTPHKKVTDALEQKTRALHGVR